MATLDPQQYLIYNIYYRQRTDEMLQGLLSHGH